MVFKGDPDNYEVDEIDGWLYYYVWSGDTPRYYCRLRDIPQKVVKLRLMEILRIGAYKWASTEARILISDQFYHYDGYLLRKGDLRKHALYYSDDTHFCLRIFEQWAEDDDAKKLIATIGNGVEICNFYMYYTIDDQGNVGRRKFSNGIKEMSTIDDCEDAKNSESSFSIKSFFSTIVYFHNFKFNKNITPGNVKVRVIEKLKEKLSNTKDVQDYSPISVNSEKIEVGHKHKTNIYYTLKNIYDKFILNNDKDNFTLNGENSEFSKMKFYNNFMHDISHEMDVPFDGVIKILDKYLSTDKSPSFIELLAETAQTNKCLFLTMPFTSDVKNEALFKPVKWWDYNKNESSSNSFVVLQPGETSKNLNTKNNEANDYLDDGFDIAIKTEKAIIDGRDCPLNDKTATAFAVTYARQTQNYFTNISVNMDNPTPTDESIANLLDISKMGGDGAVMRATPMKTSLYPVYANRSYNCSVEMMGDMGIMPLMYFQLNNVPMFRGAYMITNVSHSIRPGAFTTTFTGTRVSKFKIPLPDNTIFFNSLIELARKAQMIRSRKRIRRSGSGGIMYGTTIDIGNGKFSLVREYFAVGFTLGRLYAPNGEWLFDTVEDTYRSQEQSAKRNKVSGQQNCIAMGTYTIKIQSWKRFNNKQHARNKYFYGDMVLKEGDGGFRIPEICGIKGRSAILIHMGHDASWSEGCVIVGDAESNWRTSGRLKTTFTGTANNPTILPQGESVKRRLVNLQAAIRDSEKTVTIDVGLAQNFEQSEAHEKAFGKIKRNYLL